jgi:two-component system, NtrC family, response regulator PilR
MATLLLIDDDQAVRQMLDMLFSGTHECHTADRAEQALEFLEFQTYDVVITDISMPGLGGVEIVRRIKQRHCATPVIVISGRADEYRESLIEMGVFACFSKPLFLAELEEAVANAMALRQHSTSQYNVQPIT